MGRLRVDYAEMISFQSDIGGIHRTAILYDFFLQNLLLATLYYTLNTGLLYHALIMVTSEY